jgi:flagellar biosynthesis/type III secretory pathway protein FliH
MIGDTILKTANLRKQYVMDATRKVILSKPAEQAVSHILRKRLDLCTGQVKIQKLVHLH